MSEEEPEAPFWDHVLELRQTLLRCFCVIFCGLLICLIFYQTIIDAFTEPLQYSLGASSLKNFELKRERVFNSDIKEAQFALPPGSSLSGTNSTDAKLVGTSLYAIPPGGYLDIEIPVPSRKLALFGPIEGMAVMFKACFWTSLVITSPIWMFILMRFISPGLRKQEKNLILPFSGISSLFIGCGFLMAHQITIPAANKYLYEFNASIGTNLWSFVDYLDYTLFLMLANGMVFEMAVILLFLVHLGILKTDLMISKRRHVIVAAFILGALLTPPDILTQIMLAIPMIVLYELAITYAKIKTRVT